MNYAKTRYTPSPKRAIVWKALVSHLEKRFELGDSILDAGCGYGDFISNVTGNVHRYAIDLDPEMKSFLPEKVSFHQGSLPEIDKIFPHESMTFIFSSNVLEHLTRPEIDRFLMAAHSVLRPAGKLGILVPNYRRASRSYFDDYTHLTPISDIALADWLAACGYKLIYRHPGFMPFSIKDSRLPITPLLVRAWIESPWKPFGKQMLVVAEKPA